MDAVTELSQIINGSDNIVFFGGAGVSTESGIPDFRGSGGLYTSHNDAAVSPETILTARYMTTHPAEFFRYYVSHMLHPTAEPNRAHTALAELEKRGKLKAVITQNIDALHQKAGSVNVLELHGSSSRNYCIGCGKSFPTDFILNARPYPKCTSCGHLVKPDVVMYGEPLNGAVFESAERYIRYADVLIVGGTSLTVYPACSLVDAFSGSHFIIINKTPTPYDRYAEFVINAPIGDTLHDAVF